MTKRAQLASALALLFLPVFSAEAQVDYQPAPTPTITANNEPWYLAGDPVLHEGNIYYPAGPQQHFRNYEMMRSGVYRGIPIYVRPSLDPTGVIYVPLAGGLVHPFDRRRDGDLAGTVGSSAPSFPVVRSNEVPPDMMLPQAAGAPTAAPTFVTAPVQTAPVQSAPVVESPVEPRAVGTSGIRPAPARAPVSPRRSTANGLYIQYEGTRWFAGGRTIEFDAGAFRQVGSLNGFPVYQRAGDNATIYVPTTKEAVALVAPYRKRG